MLKISYLDGEWPQTNSSFSHFMRGKIRCLLNPTSLLTGWNPDRYGWGALRWRRVMGRNGNETLHRRNCIKSCLFLHDGHAWWPVRSDVSENSSHAVESGRIAKRHEWCCGQASSMMHGNSMTRMAGSMMFHYSTDYVEIVDTGRKECSKGKSGA